MELVADPKDLSMIEDYEIADFAQTHWEPFQFLEKDDISWLISMARVSGWLLRTYKVEDVSMSDTCFAALALFRNEVVRGFGKSW